MFFFHTQKKEGNGFRRYIYYNIYYLYCVMLGRYKTTIWLVFFSNLCAYSTCTCLLAKIHFSTEGGMIWNDISFADSVFLKIHSKSMST